MATITTNWTRNQSLRAAATLAAGATSTHALDVGGNGYDLADLQVDIIIGSSSGVTVEIFGSPDGGTTVDTTALISYTVSADDLRSIPLMGHDHVTLSLTNDDGSNASGIIAATYAGRKWASA